jgi:hypothetical protein
MSTANRLESPSKSARKATAPQPVAPFVGVVCVEPAREGVPGTDPLAERLRPVELDMSDRSRYPNEFFLWPVSRMLIARV